MNNCIAVSLYLRNYTIVGAQQFKFRQFKFLEKILKDNNSKSNVYLKKIKNMYLGLINT